MIDYHCHLLPGIDDGPESMDESLAMAGALLKSGFRRIYCTPHLMTGCYDADNRTVREAVDNLRQRLMQEKIKIEILAGREYYLDEFLGRYMNDPLPLDDTKYIMLEIPNYASEAYIKDACFRIKCSGYIPMIAHPERCEHFAVGRRGKTSLFGLSSSKKNRAESDARKTRLISYLQDIGCAFQGNIGSFAALYGPDVQHTAKYLKKHKVFTHFGTDAHSLEGVVRLNIKVKN